MEQRVAALVLRHVECVDGGRRNFAVHLRLRDYVCVGAGGAALPSVLAADTAA